MKEQLLNSASELKQPSGAAVEEFSASHEKLAEIGSQIMAGREDLVKLVGEGNQQMAQDNNRNFARFMASLFADFSPNVLVETVLWVFRAYRSHGFKTTYWAANLNIWADMVRKELSEETAESIYPFYNWLIVNIPIFVVLTDSEASEVDMQNAPKH